MWIMNTYMSFQMATFSHGWNVRIIEGQVKHPEGSFSVFGFSWLNGWRVRGYHDGKKFSNFYEVVVSMTLC